MSIELMIQPKGHGPEMARTVPIATHAMFDLYWAPAAQTLGLSWVPLFRTGVPVNADDIADIVEELLALRRAIEISASGDDGVVLPRIDRLLSELRSTGHDPDVDLYIG